MAAFMKLNVSDFLHYSDSCTGCMPVESVKKNSHKEKDFVANLYLKSFHKFEKHESFVYSSSFSNRSPPASKLYSHDFQGFQVSVSLSSAMALGTLKEYSARRRERLCGWNRSKRSGPLVPRPQTNSGNPISVCALRASGSECTDDGLDRKDKAGGEMQIIEGGDWNSNELLRSSTDQQFWEQLSVIFRVTYALGLYSGLAFASNVMCNFVGMDCWGGYQLCVDVAMKGLGYAVPPMMVLLLIMDDDVVRNWPPRRAIREVEDEELLNFFVGMRPWQFLLVVIAGSLAEELFFRVAVQGGLAHAIQMSGQTANEISPGLSALTGIVPLFLPFAQIFAAVLSAALTGSMYYIISSPRDPTYVITPVARGRNTRTDIRKRFEVWYERRQLKRIYSPLMESLLALYLGFEWVQTGNILAPMITHTLYSVIVIGNGLRRINSQREKLRQRVSEVVVQRQGQTRGSRPEKC